MRLAVLASGGGTVLQAILGAGIEVDVVLTDRDAPAEARAAAAGVNVVRVERSDYLPDREALTAAVSAALTERKIDLIAMAGFMTILSPSIFEDFPGRVINTHPSLLPSFKGAHAVTDAMRFGVKVTGCTVHVATAAVDDGPILAQRAVDIRPDDTEDTLHERIKSVEWQLYPQVLSDILAGVIDPGRLLAERAGAMGDPAGAVDA
ncbi:MAG: phosphoribosylglycinamide formyltransferase [Acidimicrobiia bacterium]|nr:phosphoribosylglycinamide formyltransferase [Acidimicrobiia bacterium]MBP8180770.1 phosphoribosylglycinamide formyltransferase [Acidimicrobiia bacterium]